MERIFTCTSSKKTMRMLRVVQGESLFFGHFACSFFHSRRLQISKKFYFTGEEGCPFNLSYLTSNHVSLLESYNFNKKKIENSLMVSRLFLKKKSLSIFEIFRGNFFGQNFFFTFSTFQVKLHTLAEKN